MSNDLELHYCSGCESQTYHSWKFDEESKEDLDMILVCEECGEIA